MSRHSNNNTASSVFTYHERQNILDDGSLVERFSHDSLRRFEYCWLCLKLATGPPVVNMTGHLFCRTCLVLNFAEQRKKWELEEKKRKLDETMNKTDSEDARNARLDQAKFENSQRIMAITEVDTAPAVPDRLEGTLYVHSDEEDRVQQISKKERAKQQLAKKRVLEVEEPKSVSFWAPHEMPMPFMAALMPSKKAKKGIIIAEGFKTKCPITGVFLRLKDLVTVKPKEEVEERPPGSSSSSSVRWVCDISDKDLAHHPVVLVKETGQLVLEDVYKKLLLGTPFVGAAAAAKDDSKNKTYSMHAVIKMQSGETVFAAHNRVEGKIFRPAFR